MLLFFSIKKTNLDLKVLLYLIIMIKSINPSNGKLIKEYESYSDNDVLSIIKLLFIIY